MSRGASSRRPETTEGVKLSRGPGYARLLLVPALITLSVTVLRLTADLLRWTSHGPPEIAWLVPAFGAYFGVQLYRYAGAPRPTRILTRAALPTALLLAAVVLFRPTSGATAVLSVVSVLLVRRAWPRLNDLLLGYAVAARAPVVIMMLAATRGGWETVYDVSPFHVAAGLLPQLTVWFALTVVLGTLSAGAALSVREWHHRRHLSDSATTH